MPFKRIPVILSEERSMRFMLLLIFFLVSGMALLRLYYYRYPVNELLTGIDDWNRYARNALDISRHGLSMPGIKGDYIFPAGFLYNYFVAGCFFIFGEHIEPVYFLQAVCLALSMVFVYLIFSDEMTPLIRPLFLLTLLFFGLSDVFRHYTFRLLSENLALLTVTSFFFCFKKGLTELKKRFFYSSALLLGITVLVRPNVFPCALLIIAWMLFLSARKKIRWKDLFLFTIIFSAGASLLAIRNHAVTGSWKLLPVDGNFFDYMNKANPDLQHFSSEPGTALSYYWKKILFCLGFLKSLQPAYSVRLHWFAMWAGYFAYLVFRLKGKVKILSWTTAAHLFILSYFGVLLLIAPIDHYGFRMLIPGNFFVIGFAVTGLANLAVRVFNLQF